MMRGLDEMLHARERPPLPEGEGVERPLARTGLSRAVAIRDRQWGAPRPTWLSLPTVDYLQSGKAVAARLLGLHWKPRERTATLKSDGGFPFSARGRCSCFTTVS